MIRIGNPHYLASTSGRCRRAESKSGIRNKLFGKPKKYRTTSEEKRIKQSQKYNLSHEDNSFIGSMIKPMA
jgi:hypothetical protein